MIGNCLENVRKNVPLVHNITNYVTVNDVANVLLACGGSPIMSDEPDDVADITSICGGLNINIGTLNKNSIEGMFIAGKKLTNFLTKFYLILSAQAQASSAQTQRLSLQKKSNLMLSEVTSRKSKLLHSEAAQQRVLMPMYRMR